MRDLLLIWLAVANVCAFVAFGLDKRYATRGDRRIPERVLLTWALVGGSPAALLAMRLFRHKTQKRSFRFWFWEIVVLQVAGLIWWFVF